MLINALRLALAIGFAALAAAPGLASESPDAESIGAGVVEEIDLAAGTLIIEGYRYRFAPQIPVRIGGVPGAATQVTPGMRMQYRFVRAPDAHRQLLEMREIPPGVVIESH
jgi:hypothetical protein